MVADVLPGLLADVQAEFERSYGKSTVVAEAFEALAAKQATYQTVNAFAVEVGDILAEALRGSVSSSVLPDGRMYYNIAKRLLGSVLGRNHELIAGYAGDVQQLLNDQAKIGLKVQVPEFNQDRLDGLVNRLDSEGYFDDVSWILQEPIVNFSQSIVDDSIRKNAEFQYESGLSPEITRAESGKCCDWCRQVVGTYRYPKVPKDVYRRHQRCKCTVEYDPKTGKVQNAHSKQWRDKEKRDSDRLARRKLNLVSVDEQERKRYNRIMKSSGAVYGAWNDKNDPYNKERDRHAEMYYEQVRNRDKALEIARVARNSGFSRSEIEKIYNHIFINEYELHGGLQRFDPSYDMAESWRRLSELSGKNIQSHDKIMLHHELGEYLLMQDGLSYEDAHAKINQKYNYYEALKLWQRKRGDL